ncbi:MAG: hypothetical protein ACFWUC_07535 [Oscillospiraceae bacterium]
MTEHKLFEIPIYSKDELSFNKLWKHKKAKFPQNTVNIGKQKMKASDVIFNIYKDRTYWEYNQIIGFITISYRNSTIYFSLFLPTPKNKLFRYDSPKKHFMIKQEHPGLHFYINNSDTNKKILENIDEQITYIKKEFLKKNWYVDDSAFKHISPYVNFKAIISK